MFRANPSDSDRLVLATGQALGSVESQPSRRPASEALLGPEYAAPCHAGAIGLQSDKELGF